MRKAMGMVVAAALMKTTVAVAEAGLLQAVLTVAEKVFCSGCDGGCVKARMAVAVVVAITVAVAA